MSLTFDLRMQISDELFRERMFHVHGLTEGDNMASVTITCSGARG
jgi:hypothetical protein